MLRLALIENLRRVVALVTAGRRDREHAGQWVERIHAVVADDAAALVRVLAELVADEPPLTDAFVAELARGLHGHNPALALPVTWLEQRLAEQGRTLEHVLALVGQSQAADQVAVGNVIGSLRLLRATDWRDFVEAMSSVEQVLKGDAAGVYPEMDFQTRDRYRAVVESIARRCDASESEVARAAVRLGRCSDGAAFEAHVGYFLVDDGRVLLEREVQVRGMHRWRSRPRRAAMLGGYIGAIAALSVAVVVGVMVLGGRAGIQLAGWHEMLAWTLLGLCATRLTSGVVQWASTVLARPRVLPRLDFSAGIPAAHRTLVAVPTLLTDVAEIDDLLEALEIRLLANRDANLSFALVTDFRDAAQAVLPTDAALLRHVSEGIAAQNARQVAAGEPASMFLFHRERIYDPGERVWMGRERKRGKLEDLNATLRGATDRFERIVGERSRLVDVRYVIVLDSDTQLPRDAARELVATLAHPLNRPQHDAARGRVTRGYAILQPRVAITMASAARSRFARLFAGEPGIDPYTRAVSDVYQDLFAEGSFVGKGIYDIDAFDRSLCGRLPAHRILSHDLLEGAYARAGLVSDILLFEDHPSGYLGDVSRRSRWMRGDWQIGAWLCRRVPTAHGVRAANTISALSQWKVFDNLRRSLVPVALLAVLAVGWSLGAAAIATTFVAAVLVVPGLLAAVAELARRPSELPRVRHAGELVRSTAVGVLREVFALAVLPYEAFIAGQAILTTAWRVLVSGHDLLEWRTASDVQRSAGITLLRSYAVMWIAPTLAIAVAIGLALRVASALPWAAPVLASWLLAPALVWWMSRPQAVAAPRLSAGDREFLHVTARMTWRFFEDFVGELDHHLPPDNFQDDPPQGVAHRTSPTNIGLSLTASLAAYDFGYLGMDGLLARITATLDTMDRLERHRGHFYNWYDTRTLEVLRPAYVSTVDSGNLSGHLLVLAAGLEELATHDVVGGRGIAGLRDTLDVLATVVPVEDVAAHRAITELRARLVAPDDAVASRRLLVRVAADGRALGDRLEPGATLAWRAWVGAFERRCRDALAELDALVPWAEQWPWAEDVPSHGEITAGLRAITSLRGTADAPRRMLPSIDRALAEAATAAHTQLQQLRDAVARAGEQAQSRLAAIERLASRCRELAQVEYGFLYDPARNLLSIGYNVSDHRRDDGFYDVLASEARLASFVAIAQGKLPQDHWFSLGRLITNAGGQPALLSWSGSMFEYLMPLLVMPTHAGTLLDVTYHGVVGRQIDHGRHHGVPWGVSESGYNKTDAQSNYQYSAFGVPGLGFKRGLGDELVVAPYASAMALMVDPEHACANLRRLAGMEMLGSHGFFEAIDYTPSRLPPRASSSIVRSYMAHHQGMAFLSLAYVLLGRPMQRRFAADRALRGAELLLEERVPRSRSIDPHPAELGRHVGLAGELEPAFRSFDTANTAAPEVHLLSKGSYHVAITNAGGGYSRWRDLAVTRWREDATRDHWGSFCYVREPGRARASSVTHQPTLATSEVYTVTYAPGRAEFRRRDGAIETLLDVSVSPEDDVELRRITVTNTGDVERTVELTSFAEVVLTQAAADAAHPAFHNLFVQTELLRSHDAILCTRRPRSSDEHPPWLLHLMTVHGTREGATSYETDRMAFIGRGRTTADPAAMHRDALGDSEGAVLDPVIAIRGALVLAPDESAHVHLVTGVATTRVAAIALVEKYRDRHAALRVLALSWTHSHVLLRQLGITEAESQVYEQLASHLLFANPTLRAPRGVIARNRAGQSSLWAYGISGDLPIAIVRIGELRNLELVRQLIKAHAYWRLKGLAADLVILNEDPSGYRQSVQDEIMTAIATLTDASLLDRPGGIFVRRSDQLSEQDKVLLQTAARLMVADAGGPLGDQLARRAYPEASRGGLPAAEGRAMLPERGRSPSAAIAKPERPDLTAFNGLGGFTHDGREYVITTSRHLRTPAPWVNVLANPWFGAVVSESGGAYTWCENAHSHRLTPWHNDPVGDASGEALYLRDDDDGEYWSPTPLPAGDDAPYVTRHGFGYSVFEHDHDGITSQLHTYVATDAPLKFLVLELRNASGRARRLSLTAFFELVLGSSRADNVAHVVTQIDPGSGAVFARNAYSSEFANRVAFLDCSEELRSVSGDRLEILGRNGTFARPACMQRTRLSGRTGAALDPCLAMQAAIELADGQTRTVVFTFGSGLDLDDARTLVQRFRGSGAAHAALTKVWDYWNRTLGAVSVRTPDAKVDFLANGWLTYQVLASRMWARSGFYQSGGAFGFRDQLQDAMALVHAEPALLREQILRAAGRQFPAGDVQHWWHPPLGRGVRTRISDDFLWLPYAVCRYVDTLGDVGVLEESVPFIEGRRVRDDEDSYYDRPLRSEHVTTVYRHCVRAIENGLRFGVHGLPLMGSGDWNDGMNLVGDRGTGESVWLGFFLHDVLRRFAPLAERQGDASFAARCRETMAQLADAIATHAWDGGWYLRAFFDDGRPLGSQHADECRIDSLPQSWAVLAGVGEPARARAGLAAIDEHLVREDLGLIGLFTPPFDDAPAEPGYVKGYVPGVRENGGQYTHAAVWAVMAFAEAGEIERAWQLFDAINPIRHGDDEAAIARYRVEPYVVAADVYTNPQHAGRGGWTWYTGSAGWMYRLLLESLLGIHREVDHLRIAPRIPGAWPGFDVHYRYRSTLYHIHVRNLDVGAPGGASIVRRVTCDGVEQADRRVALVDDGQERWVEVELGARDDDLSRASS